MDDARPHTNLRIEGFFDPATATISYLVLDRASGRAAIVDPVRDYDPKSGRTSTASAERLLQRVQELDARVDWILETHVHADHLTAAPWLKERTGARVGIGREVTTVQRVFGKLFDAEPGFARDGSQFDRLFDDGDRFEVGALQGRVMHTPGHTPACVTYVIGDAAFVGDTLFMPDYGTARCDFPGGDARLLYRSIRKVLALPASTRLFMCHDYMPGGREPRWETTVAEERARNVHVQDGVSEDAFVAMRTARDAKLEMPVLLLPSVQVNMRAGDLPPPAPNGIRYLRVPVDAL